jgi:hypothetical protein
LFTKKEILLSSPHLKKKQKNKWKKR